MIRYSAILFLCFTVTELWAQPPRITPKAAEDAFRKYKVEELDRVFPQAGPPRSRVSGTIIKHGSNPNEIRLDVDGGEFKIPSATANRLKRFPDGMPLEFEIERRGDSLIVRDFDVEAIKSWENSKRMLPPSKFGELHDQFDKLQLQIGELQKGTMGTTEDLQKTIDEIKDSAKSSYFRNDISNEEKELLCETYADVLDLGKKAIFGRDDNYRPEVYQQIYRNTGSVVALAIRGRRSAVGTGVLIGDNVVLTCLHTFRTYNRVPTDFDVWFGFEESFTDPPTTKAVFPIVKEVARGKPIPNLLDKDLDFVLLEIGKNSESQRVGDLTIGEGDAKRQIYSKADIQLAPLIRDEPIYVVGHPNRSPKMVHDNAFVLFPFRVNTDQLEHLHLLVCTEYHRAKMNNSGTMPEQDRKRFNTFLNSYVPREDGQHELYSLMWERLPVLLADCDTSQGNSGSPAFDRKWGGVIGILHGGSYKKYHDTAGWRQHEAIIPISLIVEQLDSQLPDWKSRFNVDFVDPQ